MNRALLVFLLLVLVAVPALALDLQQAKSTGLVGERPDGLVGAVQAGPGVSDLVARVNDGRMAKYGEIAARNGTTVQSVQAVAGQELVDKASPGTYVLDGGSWRRK